METSYIHIDNEYKIFASRYSIPLEVVWVLPALFERAAAMVGLPSRSLLNIATYENNEAGEYLAGKAIEVAKLVKDTQAALGPLAEK